MPPNRLCLCLTGSSLSQNIETVNRYRPYIDLLELRADFLDPEEQASLARFPSMVNLPVILTLRREADGGRFKASEEAARRQLLLKTLTAATNSFYTYLDLEEDVQDEELERLARRQGTRLIRSFHDFAGVPAALDKRIQALWHSPTDIAKAAVKVRGTADLVSLVKAAQALNNSPALAGREKILVGMDTFGMASRILAPRLGSFLTYASPRLQQQAAPGHLDPVNLQELYRYRHVSEQTAIFGIIGNPVLHSLSPHIHNHGFAELGLDAVYIPFQVDDVAAFFTLAGMLPVQGASVTIPHKEEVVRWLRQQDDGIVATGACNTIKQNISAPAAQPGTWQGINTDIGGFITPLHQHWGGKIPPGKKATVIGAGGAAKAIVYALIRAEVQVLVLNRTESRAGQLARAFGCAWGGLDRSSAEKATAYNDIIVQTTSVGMEPDTDADPFPEYIFSGKEVVYEIIYRPHLTRFLSRARQAGCPAIFGIEMLIQQALLQFRFFTGQNYPEPEKIKTFLPQ